ncbi:hypothetical protein [Mucilaginibacter sp. 3215]|uniref:hypothetical protein n=1 Tax=Mucilaginibacter sp. 3215 TaxID=3373912 RepID=UPI003D1C430C
MEDTVYLLIKVKIRTGLVNIHDAIEELQTNTAYFIGSTANVEVTETEIMELKTKK